MKQQLLITVNIAAVSHMGKPQSEGEKEMAQIWDSSSNSSKNEWGNDPKNISWLSILEYSSKNISWWYAKISGIWCTQKKNRFTLEKQESQRTPTGTI